MEFEKDLVCSIAEFIRSEKAETSVKLEDVEESERMTVVGTSSTHVDGVRMCEDEGETAETSEVREIKSPKRLRKRVRFVVPESPRMEMETRRELQELMEAREAGMAFIMGHSYVKAKRGSGLVKKVVINYGYDFLRRNSRGPSYAWSVPHASTLEVGMVYQV